MIQFEKFDCEVPAFLGKSTKRWIEEVIKSYQKKVGQIHYLFCSDEALLKINQQFLAHDYYTDIITFNKSMNNEIVSGECYISVERVMENAKIVGELFAEELHRVLIHGMLHLIGFGDGNEEEKRQMRSLEQKYLTLRLNN
ncbi:MAG: rRNA maturation RNase YbeY [Bacteroidales bacterium]|jgi:rRNA maturation RNase YbeY|nr:rRNA maturation RNase YbeY [Bacteroidales bacterium]